MDSSDLSALEDLENDIGAIIAGLEPSARRKLMRRVARDWQKQQTTRIGSQKNPDGTRFAPRKNRKLRGGGYPIRFLYPSGGGGTSRAAMMKSWRFDGHLIVGFDAEAGGMRSFDTAKIIKYIGIHPRDARKNARSPAVRQTLKSKSMFRRLRTTRNLKSGASDREAWTGFVGGIAQIARTHHEGGKDRPTKKGPEISYPARQLLGINAQETETLLDSVIHHLGL
ncbi:MAG: phage virion morphogenesis protein [Asticcacaulis sp.]